MIGQGKMTEEKDALEGWRDEKFINPIIEAAEKGVISEERINESVKRIVKMKLLHKS